MMEPKHTDDDKCPPEGMDIIQGLVLQDFKEYRDNQRNIEDFIQFLEALHYCEDIDELIEFEIPFSLN